MAGDINQKYVGVVTCVTIVALACSLVFQKFPNAQRFPLARPIQLVINNPSFCGVPQGVTEGGGIFALILVESNAGDVKLRRKMREVLSQRELEGVKMRRLFLLGKPDPSMEGGMEEILEERQEFQDILMGNFTDSFENEPLKHLMGLQWAADFCPNATYVLKQHDDIIVDIYLLHRMLTSGQVEMGDNGIFGKIRMIRRKGEPGSVSGWAYVITAPAIREILEASKKVDGRELDKHPNSNDDDHLVTGILRDISGVELVDMDDYFAVCKGQLVCCVAYNSTSLTGQPLWCDYLVGPLRGDWGFMRSLLDHSRECHVSGKCGRREGRDLLRIRCPCRGSVVDSESAGQCHCPTA